MHAWRDETCGAEGWATAPAGTAGVVNNTIALYFEDAAFAMPLSPVSAAATGSRRLRVPMPSVTMHGKHNVLRLFIRPPSRRFRPSK